MVVDLDACGAALEHVAEVRNGGELDVLGNDRADGVADLAAPSLARGPGRDDPFQGNRVLAKVEVGRGRASGRNGHLQLNAAVADDFDPDSVLAGRHVDDQVAPDVVGQAPERGSDNGDLRSRNRSLADRILDGTRNRPGLSRCSLRKPEGKCERESDTERGQTPGTNLFA